MANFSHMKKSAMSLKQFISEYGVSFSDHMKDKLMELESRSFLTRKDAPNRFDLKHVEHIEYECTCDSGDTSATKLKEYTYGQFEVNDEILYFSENCLESAKVMQSPMVRTIYNTLDNEGAIFNAGRNLKKVSDKNIDYIVNSTLSTCPQVSQKYLDIVQSMITRADNKQLKTNKTKY